MGQVMTRYFYPLDMVKVIDKVVSSYHQCASLGSSLSVAIPQSSEDPRTLVDSSLPISKEK